MTDQSGRVQSPVAKRDSEPTPTRHKWGAEPYPTDGRPPNPGVTECCGGSTYNAHGFGVCWGPRWVGRLRGYDPRRGCPYWPQCTCNPRAVRGLVSVHGTPLPLPSNSTEPPEDFDD